jgi:hypothetical protein
LIASSRVPSVRADDEIAAKRDRLRIPARAAEALLTSDGWRDRASLRAVVGSGTMLAYAGGTHYSYLAVDTSETGLPLKPALPAVVVLRAADTAPVVINFGLLGSGTPSSGAAFSLDSQTSVLLHQKTIRPRTGESMREQEYLGVTGLTAPDAVEIAGPDLIGIRAGNWVVLFHTEATAGGSPQSFEVPRGETLHFLITGLAPGIWEIWRNGWLEQIDGVVRAGASVLDFTGPPGHYFLRKL